MSKIFEAALVYATVSPPEITSAAPIKVSCPNFMPPPPYPARKLRQICRHSAVGGDGPVAAQYQKCRAITSRRCRLAQADATGLANCTLIARRSRNRERLRLWRGTPGDRGLWSARLLSVSV